MTDLVEWLSEALDEAERDATQCPHCVHCQMNVDAAADTARRTVAAHRAILDQFEAAQRAVERDDLPEKTLAWAEGVLSGVREAVVAVADIYRDGSAADPSWTVEG